MSGIKSFRTQLRECIKNKTQIEEKCHVCGNILLMCQRYGGQCISNKCKEARINE